jgi:predicted amidohydrolase
MSRELTLALVQMDSEFGNIQRNVERIIDYTKQARAQGAEIVAFPELILSGSHPEMLGSRLQELALSREDEPIQKLADAARESGIYLLAGFLERRDTSGAVYNSLVWCAPNGKVVDTYAKTHMYTTERRYFSFGHQSPVYETEFGKIGIMICYELCFPEVARILALKGAEVLIAPAAWGTLDEMQWPIHVRARALENLVFMSAVNRAGVEGNLHYIGQSMVVHPLGNIAGHLDTDQEEMVVTTINLDQVAAARKRSEHWVDRRPELYKLIADPNPGS